MADTKNGPLCTPYDNPACPTHGAGDSSLGGPKGGWSLPDAPAETPNMSELGLLPTTTDIAEAPAAGSAVTVSAGVTAPGIPFTDFGKK